MHWNTYFFNFLDVIKQKSKDPSTKVGCVIVGKNNEVISTGFNGFPMKVLEKPSRYERPVKYFYIEHAERNAVYLAARRGVPLEGSRIYLQWHPCADCARAIIQAGIEEVWIDGSRYDPYNPTEADRRWEESISAAQDMFEEARIRIVIFKEK
jgi:dCMP deaminase